MKPFNSSRMEKQHHEPSLKIQIPEKNETQNQQVIKKIAGVITNTNNSLNNVLSDEFLEIENDLSQAESFADVMIWFMENSNEYTFTQLQSFLEEYQQDPHFINDEALESDMEEDAPLFLESKDGVFFQLQQDTYSGYLELIELIEETSQP